MDVGTAFVTCGQAPHPLHPGEGTFHHPAVTTELLAIFDATADNSGTDVPDATGPAATSCIEGLVCMQLAWTLQRQKWLHDLPKLVGYDLLGHTDKLGLSWARIKVLKSALNECHRTANPAGESFYTKHGRSLLITILAT